MTEVFHADYVAGLVSERHPAADNLSPAKHVVVVGYFVQDAGSIPAASTISNRRLGGHSPAHGGSGAGLRHGPVQNGFARHTVPWSHRQALSRRPRKQSGLKRKGWGLDAGGHQNPAACPHLRPDIRPQRPSPRPVDQTPVPQRQRNTPFLLSLQQRRPTVTA